MRMRTRTRSHTLKLHSILALALSLCLLSAGALASGSYKQPGGDSDEGGNYGEYGLGKQAYLNKIVCTDCPYPNKTFNLAGAKELINKISRNDIENVPLYEKERRALIIFLKKRHKIW